MDIEAAVHTRWATYAPLVELVPAAKFVTGTLYDEPELPYVSLGVEGETPDWRSSDGEGIETALRFSIFDSDLGRAKKIAQRIKDRFDRKSFAIRDGNCYVMQWTNELRLPGEDGVWTVLVDYSCRQAA